MDEPTADTQNIVDQMENIIGSDATELSQQPTTEDILDNIDGIISSDTALPTTTPNSNISVTDLENKNTSADSQIFDKNTTPEKETLIAKQLVVSSTDNSNDSSSIIKSAIVTDTSTYELSSHKRHIEEEDFKTSKVPKFAMDEKSEMKLPKFVMDDRTETEDSEFVMDNKTESFPTLSEQSEPKPIHHSEKLVSIRTQSDCDLLTSETKQLVNITDVSEDNEMKSKEEIAVESEEKENKEDLPVCMELEENEEVCVELEKEKNVLLQEVKDNSSSAVTMVATEPSLSAEHEVVEQQDVAEELWDRYFTESSFSSAPVSVTGAWTDYEHMEENYLRGCKWSPDGTCILTNSNDNCLRIFNLPDEFYSGVDNVTIPEMHAVLKMKEAEMVYDYCWFPLMRSSDPATCCLASTSRDTPIHMWDAFTGELRCSYRAFNQVDEVVAAHCLAFSLDGRKLYSGFNKMIRVFDVSQPGRECQSRPTYKKQGQSGIISCIAPSPQQSGLYAAGSYSRAVALYEENSADMVCMFKGQQGGVTHIMFSPDGTKLYSGGRKDPEILCWDLRNPGQILFVVLRQVLTNQRIYFDLDSSGHFLMSGNNDGRVTVWDTSQSPQKAFTNADPFLEPTLTYTAHKDAVNGTSVHPSLQLLATSSGQRHFSFPGDSDESDTENVQPDTSSEDNSLKIWSFER